MENRESKELKNQIIVKQIKINNKAFLLEVDGLNVVDGEEMGYEPDPSERFSIRRDRIY